MTYAVAPLKEKPATDLLTECLESKLRHPATSPEFDLHRGRESRC